MTCPMVSPDVLLHMRLLQLFVPLGQPTPFTNTNISTILNDNKYPTRSN